MSTGILGMMFLIMFALKLAGPMAAVSWAVVTAPIWVPVLIALSFLLLGAFYNSYK